MLQYRVEEIDKLPGLLLEIYNTRERIRSHESSLAFLNKTLFRLKLNVLLRCLDYFNFYPKCSLQSRSIAEVVKDPQECI